MRSYAHFRINFGNYSLFNVRPGSQRTGAQSYCRISDLFSYTEWKKDCFVFDTLGMCYYCQHCTAYWTPTIELHSFRFPAAHWITSNLEQILEIPDYSMCCREAERVELNRRSPVHCAVLAIVARPPTYPKPSNLSSILCMRTDPKSYDSIGFFFERKSLFSVLTSCV